MDGQTPANHRGGKRSVAATIAKAFGTVVLVCVIAALMFFTIFAIYIYQFILPQAQLNIDGFSLDQTSVIYYYDTNGNAQELQKLYGTENRIWAQYEEIPLDLVFACVAIEDKRFFEHNGVDWLRTAKACVNMFLGDTSSFGASTITQQLIKNLTDNDEVTVRRKLIEIFRALKFEENYSKHDILEWYLNTIYLGEQCYGVKSAAHAYFGKDVSELTTAECAALIGITNNPSIYDPYINEDKCISRQKDILWAMHEQGYLTDEEYEEAKSQKLVFQWDSTGDEEETYVYSYFVDQVIRDVASDLSHATGYSYDIAYQLVLSGGYEIYATIKPDVQEILEAVYTDERNLPQTPESWQSLQSAMVITSNTTGDIVAMVGGFGKKEGSLTFSRATQSRLSPGSIIKPISVYAPALEQGLITPYSVYDDTPYSVYNGLGWPKNENRVYRGLTNIRTAMADSTNTVAVKVLDDVGLQNSFQFASGTMGLRGLVEAEEINGVNFTDVSYGALALGGLTRGVTVKSLTEAYTAFANEGVYRNARTYTQVCAPDGTVVLDNPQTSTTAVNETTAWYLTDMMQYTVQYGTGMTAQLDNMPVAGKTGTTSNDFDRWFAGYTPYYTGVVWVGYDEPQEIVILGDDVNPASALWQKVMSRVHEKLAYRDFNKPSSIVSCQICQDTGLLAGEWCSRDLRGSRVLTVEMALEDMPTKVCTTHVGVGYCSESGMVANDYCQLDETVQITRRALLDIRRAMVLDGVVVEDQQYTVPGREEEIPAGYYRAETGVEHPVNEVCQLHEQPPEPEEPTEDNLEGTGDTVSEDDSSFWDWLNSLIGESDEDTP